MSLESRKKAEGLAHLANAEKYLETSVWKLKLSPDWDSAADQFNKAAVSFKVAKDWDACKAAHLRACEGYANSGSLYHAGKQLDQALLVCKERGDLTEIEDLASRGGLLYRQAGSPESAAQMLVRAAKMLEIPHPERAISLYEKASETVGTEDRPSEAGQHLETAAKLTVRAGQLDRAADLLHNTLVLYSEAGTGNNSQHGRVVLAFILVQIKRGDSIAAGKVWSQWGGWCDGSQSGAANDIIQGFTDQDGDMARQGLSSSSVKTLDNDYVKLARDIEVPNSQGDDEDLDLC